MFMKKYIKKVLKKLLNAREDETISDAVSKNKYNILRKFNKKNFDIELLKANFINLGIKKGDTIIIHSAWRSFIGFKGTPQDVIDCISEIVGREGTILMPAYTHNKEIFHYNDKSSAGYISEVFRNNKNTDRSLNNIFSMCASGKNKKELLSKHVDSLYCFDSNSPYYKAMESNAKILLLGLGRSPHKITLFHCASYELRNKINCYKDVYTFKKNVTMYDDNEKKIKRKIIERQPKYQNNKRKFRKLFKIIKLNKNYIKINYLDVYLIESKPFYKDVCDYMLKHNYNIYKK